MLLRRGPTLMRKYVHVFYSTEYFKINFAHIQTLLFVVIYSLISV